VLRALVLLAATLSLVLAACGESDEDKFADDYQPVGKKLEDLGGEVGDALQAAENKSDKELSEQFAGFADQMADVQKEVEELDPPASVEKDVADLEKAIDNVEGSLQDIADAGEQNDPAKARTATLALIQQGERLDEVEKKVAAAAAK
jgi:hypothetical protein